MVSVAKLSVGQERYYLEGAAERVDAAEAIGDGVEDYYVNPAEARGCWTGTAAERLGLRGDVDGDQLRRLLAGTNPTTGTALRTVRSPLKVAAYDLTFSAPKSVSVLFGVGDAATSAAVRAAHDVAAAQALGYVERSAAAVRRGHRGVVIEATDGLLAAAFRHRSSRAGDPQLHTHVVVANLGQGTDGRWTALDGRRLFAHATTASHLYQAVLRAELTRTLGVRWTPVVRGIAEVDGVPTTVLKAFSRRRAEIEAALAERGTSGPRAAEAAAVATRRQKDHSVGVGDLAAEWRRRADALGWPARHLDRVQRESSAPESSDRDALVAWLTGPDGLTAQASTFTRRDVVRAIAGLVSPDAPMTAVALELFADDVLRSAEVVPLVDAVGAEDGTCFRRRDGRLLKTGDEERRHTTRELLVTEQRLLAAAAGGRRAGRGVSTVSSPADARLSGEQRQAVVALIDEGDSIAVLAGRAGTGKTFALAAARNAWEDAGLPVLGAAVARRAAHELERGAGIPSTSVASLLANLDRRPASLPAGAVLVVDEAGMLGTRDLARLVDHVKIAGGKLVLVGDHHQLPEIDAGGVFQALVRRGHAVELRENRRQVHAWERTAIDHLRDGRADEAVAIYVAHDRIHLQPDAETTRQRLVEDWRSAHGDAVMIASRRVDVDDLNRRARHTLRAAGQLGAEELRAGGRTFSAGDRIVIRRNDPQLEVANGDRGTVLAVDPARDRLVLDLAGRRVEVGTSFLRSRTTRSECPIQHAYAVTCHVAQGATVDSTFILGDQGLCREWGYTALTRGREANHLYISSRTEVDRAEYGPLGTATTPPDPLSRLAADLTRAEAKTLALDAGRYRPLDPDGRGHEGRSR